jgi:hypothetical protein
VLKIVVIVFLNLDSVSRQPISFSVRLRITNISISASRTSRLERVSLARDREFRMEMTLDRIRIVIICTDPD